MIEGFNPGFLLLSLVNVILPNGKLIFPGVVFHHIDPACIVCHLDTFHIRKNNSGWWNFVSAPA